MLNLLTVQKCLIRLNAHYPESGHTAKTIKIVAEDWYEDLQVKHISDERFIALAKEARRENTFFPKIADILKLDAVLPQTHIQIEQKPNPAEMGGWEIVKAVQAGVLPESTLAEYGLDRQKKVPTI